MLRRLCSRREKRSDGDKGGSFPLDPTCVYMDVYVCGYPTISQSDYPISLMPLRAPPFAQFKMLAAIIFNDDDDDAALCHLLFLHLFFMDCKLLLIAHTDRMSMPMPMSLQLPRN